MVRETDVTFLSGDLTLEGCYYAPEALEPSAAVVVCHPHPQYGGDMTNLVVAVVVHGLTEAGLGALVFNFRGVGYSQGSFDNGVGEREDVKAALDYAGSLPGIERVGLAGYSFGAGMAAAAVESAVRALALVALPPRMVTADAGLRTYAGPALMVSGGADNVSPEGPLRELASSLPSTPEVTIVPGADHMWWGHERALADAVRDFFAKHMGG